jgi:hypothetical protein
VESAEVKSSPTQWASSVRGEERIASGSVSTIEASEVKQRKLQSPLVYRFAVIWADDRETANTDILLLHAV